MINFHVTFINEMTAHNLAFAESGLRIWQMFGENGLGKLGIVWQKGG